MANWTKLLYVLVIALLYVPMVFLGSNVFFPKFTGIDSSPIYKDCYGPQRIVEQTSGSKVDLTCSGVSTEPGTPIELKCAGASIYTGMSAGEIETQQEKMEQCNTEQREAQIAWEQERNKYDGWKYLAITIFNLVIVLAILFIGFKETVVMGLFFGAVAATFGATIRYWDYARTKFGFLVLVLIFFIVLYFINRRQDSGTESKSKKR